MPILKCEPLETLARDVFRAITVPPAGAAWMAKLLVRANLRGHDSHGVIRVPQYVASWKKGEADPKAEPVVVQDGPATALVDGKRGFGQIVARRGMEVAMAKAAAIGVAAVGVYNSNHIGRLADYTEMALERDMLALLAVNAGGAGQRMAPWGGRAPRLSTNPFAFACPDRQRSSHQLRRGHHGGRGRQGAGQAQPQRADAARLAHRRRRQADDRSERPLRHAGGKHLAGGRPQGILPGPHGGGAGRHHGARGPLPRESGTRHERDLHGRGGHRPLRLAADTSGPRWTT